VQGRFWGAARDGKTCAPCHADCATPATDRLDHRQRWASVMAVSTLMNVSAIEQHVGDNTPVVLGPTRVAGIT